ncbi:trypsin-like peptidase domain-containing protein [Chryseolinea lacunae]|uniref:Trypsin-like peptidase domain-containing protein n=1 Tax=Chryseolinea lacunae TaxID=2801331 RepID=A0ABS1KL91_9BACT|nr:trypsin-like peptidase domain-containing protein [Chryseolinea lacunae]MBL0740230.1 trypsin-like peptidase domain-containing protein [Chryseolinea lacunae]
MKRSILILIVMLTACIGGILGAIFTLKFLDVTTASYSSIEQRQQSVQTAYGRDTAYNISEGMNFLSVAQKVTPGVVHIRTSYGPGDFSVNPLEFYMDSPARSSGSGVIISDDGYIVTNNHVVEDASNIEVVMNNNQRFYAKLIGADPTTDLALLKIRAQHLPFLKYGDSDKITPGEWVLAVGNPFDLNSTVTAGIVSAKARNIGILRDRNNLQVEAFIQTDAAVNPGNSGGALVNLRGELIGINSAIATSSGSYQGYSFAIPVSLAKKVMDDLLEFGQVQRGLLGIQITDVNASIAEDLHLNVNQGVLVNRVNTGSAAEQSGLSSGDVIVGIDGHAVNSVSELQEWVARNRPGKEIRVAYLREGGRREVKARLRNNEGNETVTKKEVKYDLSGVQIEDIPYKELASLQLEGGVRVISVATDKWKDTGIKKGFVIAYIDKVPVDNVEDLNRILEFKRGGILIEGFYPGGQKGTYGVDW